MVDEYEKRYSPDVLVELGKQYLKVAGNPATRATVLRAHKQVNPNFAMPVDVQLAEFKAQEAQRRDAEKLEAQGREVTERLATQKAKLLEKYTPEQVAEIETKVMQKYGLSDYEAAAQLYATNHQTPANRQDTRRHGAVWTFPDLPGLLDDPAKAARETAEAMIDEMNRSRG